MKDMQNITNSEGTLKREIPISNIDNFFRELDSGLVNSDSKEVLKKLDENDYTEIFEQMLKSK